MKHVLMVAVTFGLCQFASASPICIDGTLASYQLLGSGGCSIGANTLTSFTTDAGITGATPILPSAVSIVPGGGAANPSLAFTVTETASPGQLFESIFTYGISGPAYSMDQITLSGSSETGNGAVSDIQNFCAGGSFGPNGVTGCTGPASGNLLALDGIQNMDQSPLSSPNSLSITDDFVLDSGITGSASGGTFVDQFTAASSSTVPEPSAYLLAGTGLVLAAIRRFRSVNGKL